jgi:hypothetical protein
MEAQALLEIEAFQRTELGFMHQMLASSESGLSASFLGIADVRACCRTSELRQRRQLMEILTAIKPDAHWALVAEWEPLLRSGSALFQAAAVFVAWLHQRFELHYQARDPTDNLIPAPDQNESLRPYLLRALSLPPDPPVRRIRLAGWRCDQASGAGVYASLLTVPSLRDPQRMVAAIQDAAMQGAGPFHRKPTAKDGLTITELVLEAPR